MTAVVTVLYFASLAEQLDTHEEQLALPATPYSINDLRQWLARRGEQWSALTSNSVRSAVNQQIANDSQLLQGGEEVAFFPPVTGG